MPTPITMDAAVAEAYANADPQDVFFDTISFTTEPAAGEPLKVLCSPTCPQWFSERGFVACPFEFKLPATEPQTVGTLEISVTLLPKEAIEWLNHASVTDLKIFAQWKQYISKKDENGDLLPPILSAEIAPLAIVSVEHTTTTTTAVATVVDLLNMPFPKRIMTTEDLPGAIE